MHIEKSTSTKIILYLLMMYQTFTSHYFLLKFCVKMPHFPKDPSNQETTWLNTTL